MQKIFHCSSGHAIDVASDPMESLNFTDDNVEDQKLLTALKSERSWEVAVNVALER